MKSTKTLFIALGLALCGTAIADGRVLYTKGEVRIERGEASRMLVRGARVREGDTIETGSSGRAHIRMADRTLLSLRPDTRLTIEEYSYAPPPAAVPVTTKAQQIAAAAQASGRSFYGLFKGGFRTITGLIGKRDRTTFGIRTPVATIGIRGTTFDTVCINECRDGLVAVPWDGSIRANNSGGSVTVVSGETLLVPGADVAPRLDIGPHPELIDDGIDPPATLTDDGSDDALAGLVVRRTNTDDGFAAGGASEPTRRETEDPTTDDTDEPATRAQQDIAYATGPFAANPGGDAIHVSSRPEFFNFNAAGELQAFVGVIPSDDNETGLAAAVFRTGGENPVTIDNVGFDRDTGNRWGRYSGGELRIDTEDGESSTLALQDQGFHWVTSPANTGDIAIPRQGSQRYTVFGNTDPTNNLGDSGILGDATLVADFGSSRVTSTVSLGINDRVWNASGSGPLGAALDPGGLPNAFAGSYDSVTAGGVAGSGDFAGFLNADALGAGLSYVLRRPAGGSASEIVSGALSFRASN